jgi:hypothetical protein
MSLFLSTFEQRKQEIHPNFNFVQTIEIEIREKKYVLPIEDESFNFVKVFKANCYVMLYNRVEGAVTEAIDAIFAAISIQPVYFKDLIPAYKKIGLAYQQGLVKIAAESAKAKDPTKNKIGQSIAYVLDHLEFFKITTFTDKEGNTFDNYKGYLKVVDAADLSGNLDAKKMRDLAEK